MPSPPQSIPRCQHIKANQTRCASPALRGRKFCYFHQQSRQKQLQRNANIRRQRKKFTLLIPQDAESIKLDRIKAMSMRAFQRADDRTAELMLYALRTASTLKRTQDPKPAGQNSIFARRRVS